VSTTCVVFARSEAAARLREGCAREEVLAAYLGATARRIVDLVERLTFEPALGFTGGIAKNPGVVRRVEALLGTTSMTCSLDPQLAGAIGAALFGDRIYRSKKR
jgi:benzoyl-CoA reductase subunit A